MRAAVEAKDAAAKAAGVQTEKAKAEAEKVAGQAQGKAAELKVSFDASSMGKSMLTTKRAKRRAQPLMSRLRCRATPHS